MMSAADGMVMERATAIGVAPGIRPGRVIDGNPEQFAAFNRASFRFHHRLAGHPLFTLPRLAEAAQAMLDRGDRGRFVVFDARSFSAGSGFGGDRPQERLAATVRNLDEGRTWLKLSGADAADPAYAEVLREAIDDLAALTGQDLANEITWSSLTIFMASPGIATPYHIDHESNFLLQVQGDKDICLFDPDDREVLPTHEIEQFYLGDPEAARYRPELQARGTVHRLSAGLAAHHPPLAPHWVRNGEAVSVSVSIGFCMRALDRRAKVHQTNSLLRRAGLRPAAPGGSALRDRCKSIGLEWATRRSAAREDILFSGVKRASAALGRARRLIVGSTPTRTGA